jgi:hypothetical protein
MVGTSMTPQMRHDLFVLVPDMVGLMLGRMHGVALAVESSDAQKPLRERISKEIRRDTEVLFNTFMEWTRDVEKPMYNVMHYKR